MFFDLVRTACTTNFPDFHLEITIAKRRETTARIYNRLLHHIWGFHKHPSEGNESYLCVHSTQRVVLLETVLKEENLKGAQIVLWDLYGLWTISRVIFEEPHVIPA